MNNYFKVSELCVSGSYPKLVQIPKEGSAEYNNIMNLINKLLNPVREKLGKPIIVTSGYRPKPLNDAVGGSPTSNHLTGCAADIHINNGSNVEIIEALLDLGITYDECISERSVFNKKGELTNCSWVHVALKPYNNRRKFIYTTDMKHYYPLKVNKVICK